MTTEQFSGATTIEVSNKLFSKLALQMEGRGTNEEIEHFVRQLIFCVMADSAKLIPNEVLTKLLMRASKRPDLAKSYFDFLFNSIENHRVFRQPPISEGSNPLLFESNILFDGQQALQLDSSQLELLTKAKNLDWTQIDPEVFFVRFDFGDSVNRVQIIEKKSDESMSKLEEALRIDRPHNNPDNDNSAKADKDYLLGPHYIWPDLQLDKAISSALDDTGEMLQDEEDKNVLLATEKVVLATKELLQIESTFNRQPAEKNTYTLQERSLQGLFTYLEPKAPFSFEEIKSRSNVRMAEIRRHLLAQHGLTEKDISTLAEDSQVARKIGAELMHELAHSPEAAVELRFYDLARTRKNFISVRDKAVELLVKYKKQKNVSNANVRTKQKSRYHSRIQQESERLYWNEITNSGKSCPIEYTKISQIMKIVSDECTHPDASRNVLADELLQKNALRERWFKAARDFIFVKLPLVILGLTLVTGAFLVVQILEESPTARKIGIILQKIFNAVFKAFDFIWGVLGMAIISILILVLAAWFLYWAIVKIGAGNRIEKIGFNVIKVAIIVLFFLLWASLLYSVFMGWI